MAFRFNPLTANFDLVGAIAPAGTTTYVETFTLNGTDITNGYVTLANTPTSAASTVLLVKDAPSQYYGDDFQIVSSNRVSWASLALDGILASGDKLTILYF